MKCCMLIVEANYVNTFCWFKRFSGTRYRYEKGSPSPGFQNKRGKKIPGTPSPSLNRTR
jgi:hypothetical protein